MNGEDVLIPLGFFAMVVSIVYLALRQKERMSLIARGLNPDDMSGGCESALQLKAGLFLIGLALGVLSGDIMANYSKLEPWASHLSMICIFTGGALLLSYFLLKKYSPNKRRQEP